MPPRIPLSTYLRATNVCSSLRNGNALILPLRPFSTSHPNHTPAPKVKNKFRDPYVVAQARARKAANLSRQEELKKERTVELGDPVRGSTTPYVESFDTGRDPDGDNGRHLTNFVKHDELEEQLEQSKSLLMPLPVKSDASEDQPSAASKAKDMENLRKHEKEHANVQEAMKRILNLDNGNAQGRLRVNIQRCIETFGRHETDEFLDPKPAAIPSSSSTDVELFTTKGEEGLARPDTAPRTPNARRGPDTGSSEVQIAILTAKIRSLANFLDTRGRKDKVGKRDLRLLVHRRQKLLKYLKRKERGGPRWQRCIETLGLTEGTWQGEISL